MRGVIDRTLHEIPLVLAVQFLVVLAILILQADLLFKVLLLLLHGCDLVLKGLFLSLFLLISVTRFLQQQSTKMPCT